MAGCSQRAIALDRGEGAAPTMGAAQQAGSLNSYIITWHGLFQISYRFAACRLPPAACRLIAVCLPSKTK